MKKVLCILLSVIFSLITLEITPLCLVLNAENYAEISIEADFSEERIIVILTNEASLNSKSISQNDLKSIGISKVSDISTASGNLVRSAKENITNHVLNGEKLLPYNGIPLGEYHQILCLELDEPGKENVINVIKEVQKNEDVLYVCPDYKLKKCETTPNDEYYLASQNAEAEIIGLKKRGISARDYQIIIHPTKLLL